MGFLSELPALKIDLFLHQQGSDATISTGKATIGVMGVFPEFKPSMISVVLPGASKGGRQEIRSPKIDEATETRYASQPP
jgi:hypothetical protein